ncbi:endonuclease/exonuclease/phosphatase family protein [Ignatzschineria cameli]|uniref:endonuclease/exonuclease/phosphatase family protein n=1 Tax=Ignatzschineria cameli TaxID=2182793 RepID=UPI0010581F52|nr:endonuclease/exonuclease/phosphatase family protein [Ignatzschineria cameli]
MEEQLISFIWWNTSLSFGKKRNLEDESRKVIFDTINKFTSSDVDCIVLTEISEEDVKEIRVECNLRGYKIRSIFDKVGKTHFDFCVIYKNATLEILGQPIKIDKIVNNKSYKLGVRVKFFEKNSKEIFHTIFSHWPARIYGTDIQKRNEMSARLRFSIESDIIEKYRADELGEPFIILLGDYNEEPFSVHLSENLKSTRDKFLVKKKPDLFYNPFWGDLSLKENQQHIGSYYFKKGDITRWYTLDQIMYSHAFVDGKEWEVVDFLDRIMAFPELFSLITDNESKLDHFPILGIIRKVN